MAKKNARKVVQRSFVKGHSFRNSLYVFLGISQPLHRSFNSLFLVSLLNLHKYGHGVLFFTMLSFFQTAKIEQTSEMVYSHGFPDPPLPPSKNFQGNYESCWTLANCEDLSNTMLLVYSELAYNLTYDCHSEGEDRQGSYTSSFFKYRISTNSFLPCIVSSFE